MNLDDRSDWEPLSVTRAAESLDAAWFAAHPEEECRKRAALPGELGMHGQPRPSVLVNQIRPGCHLRGPGRWWVLPGTGEPRTGNRRAPFAGRSL